MSAVKKLQSCSIVIPTIRQESIILFLAAWEKEFKGKHIVIVEDNPHKSFSLPSWVEHYSWEEIDKVLGKNAWIFSRRNASIRAFGFLKAQEKRSDFIVTLDDDCLPEPRYKNGGFLREISSRLNTTWESDTWFNTLGSGLYPRGFPYNIRNKKQPTVIHHGLWSHIPDLDGKTQLQHPTVRTQPFTEVGKIPYGKYFPMCSMNLSFRKEMLPCMYFLLMGQDAKGKKWPYDRFDDIWAGIFAKKICDHLGFAISSGSPSVHHAKASDALTNSKKEKSGLGINERLWKEMDAVPLSSNTVSGCYLEIAASLGKKGKYWKTLSDAMKIWVTLVT